MDAAEGSLCSTAMGGVGGELLLVTEGKQFCGGFFYCKPTDHQRVWLPCKIEALAISCCITHWDDILRRSLRSVEIQTDSILCCLVYGKLQ